MTQEMLEGMHARAESQPRSSNRYSMEAQRRSWMEGYEMMDVQIRFLLSNAQVMLEGMEQIRKAMDKTVMRIAQ